MSGVKDNARPAPAAESDCVTNPQWKKDTWSRTLESLGHNIDGGLCCGESVNAIVIVIVMH